MEEVVSNDAVPSKLDGKFPPAHWKAFKFYKTQFQKKLFARLKEYFGSHLHAAALDAHSDYCVHRRISLPFLWLLCKTGSQRSWENWQGHSENVQTSAERGPWESNWQPYRKSNSANHWREVRFTKSNSEMPLVSNAECSQNKHNISIQVNMLSGKPRVLLRCHHLQPAHLEFLWRH